jgi:antitoxin HigA-1
MAKKLKPVHPGEILREEFMTPPGLSMNQMALDLRVPVTRIADIIAKRRGITADTALRFARYFKNSPAFWMNLQTCYELEVAENESAAEIDRDVRPLEPAPRGRRVDTPEGGRFVALKFLPDQLARDPQALEHFRRERIRKLNRSCSLHECYWEHCRGESSGLSTAQPQARMPQAASVTRKWLDLLVLGPSGISA